ncbi:baseplate J/gp47 family protein [Pendulispora brunnea]|uniref:Baseplate J/gp47 family protein n=1 Tax=Pendulispora brunnea TaxID=2905690 RepID=A0ABZ2KP15_9BACT
MPLDDLPGEIVTFGRDEVRDRYLRDYLLRNPSADTGPGSLPYARASVMADTLAPIYANAIIIGRNVAGSTKTGRALLEEAARLGTAPLPAAGASGAVEITASQGGTKIFAGDELRVSGRRYQAIATGVYASGAQVPVQGIDTGPSTNVAAGMALSWTWPRPGCSPTAIVIRQFDGSGLSGGRDAETESELQDRLRSLRSNPPAAGNEADYIQAVTRTPGLSVEAAFAFPAIKGPGTKGVIFTMRPGTAGANRSPNTAQIARVLQHLRGRFPADDGIFVGAIVPKPVTIALRVDWRSQVPGWVDSYPWPEPGGAMVKAVTSAVDFVVSVQGRPPERGLSFGLFDRTAAQFRPKRVLTAAPIAAGSTDYRIVADTSNATSDVNYTPEPGQALCPWSDSLDSLVASVIALFDRLGPGEQCATFFDPGLRQRRIPIDPEAWPSAITNRMLSTRRDLPAGEPVGVFDVPTVRDAALISPQVPYGPPPGAPGMFSHLLVLQDLVAYA